MRRALLDVSPPTTPTGKVVTLAERRP